MIFVVSDDLETISKIKPGSFVEFKVWERARIQEWVRTLPEILGEDLLIVSREFEGFVALWGSTASMSSLFLPSLYPTSRVHLPWKV